MPTKWWVIGVFLLETKLVKSDYVLDVASDNFQPTLLEDFSKKAVESC